MATLVGEAVDVGQAAQIESSLPPGTYEARLSLTSPLSQEELDMVHQQLLDAGVDIQGFVQQRVRGLWQLSIKYRIHPVTQTISQAALLIPMIPTVVIAVLVGIALFKIQELTILLVVAGAVVIVGGLVYRSIQKGAR